MKYFFLLLALMRWSVQRSWSDLALGKSKVRKINFSDAPHEYWELALIKGVALGYSFGIMCHRLGIFFYKIVWKVGQAKGLVHRFPLSQPVCATEGGGRKMKSVKT